MSGDNQEQELREFSNQNKNEEPVETPIDDNQGVLLMIHENDDNEKNEETDEIDSISHITGRRGSATSRRPSHPSLTIAASAPAELAGSPIKRVQFEVGDGEDDFISDSDRVSHSGAESPITTPTRSGRGEIRDYLITSTATLALLPAIAEEKPGNVDFGRLITPPPYPRSASLALDISKTGFSDDKSDSFGFVQMDILTGLGEMGTREWKEVARWIKYEENLEEGSDRWGKPVLPIISYNSLIKLRQLIERDGTILLDLEEREMPGVAYRVVEELGRKNLIKSEDSPLVMRALLLRHRHVEELESRGWFGLKRNNTASVVSLQSLFEDRKRPDQLSTTIFRRNSKGGNESLTSSSRSLPRTSSGNYLKPAGEMTFGEMKPLATECNQLSEDDWYKKENMRRLLPPVTEATSIMVASDFEYVTKPIFIFVRLSESAIMVNVTEETVPVRFFSIILAPPSSPIDLIEIGRSFGTLMSNRAFFELATLVVGRKGLVVGINEFLEDSIILPPGDWDNHDLPTHFLQSKSSEIKMKRLKKQLSFVLSASDSFVENGANGGLQMTTQIESAGQERKDLEDNRFKRTGRLFGGLMNDFKRRYPLYKSDIMDGFHLQCVAVLLFMFFASIAQIITFAGLMAKKTGDHIGLTETLMSTSLNGVFFALASCQPVIPVGPTGPLLVFDEILYNFCVRHELDFLPCRAMISIWLFSICLFVVALDGSVVVKWLTRFSQEIFAVLTSVLFIFESVDNLVEIYVHHPLTSLAPAASLPINISINKTHYSLLFEEATPPTIIDETRALHSQPNTALLCTILMLGTFFIAYFLREFRNSVFLGEKARRALGDFGVPIAISLMVFLDYCATDTYTQKMLVPPGLEPSQPEGNRTWVILPWNGKRPMAGWLPFLLFLPASLLFVLIFMTVEICQLIMSSKERKLKKGTGFHSDLLIISLINLINGLLGCPWICCATLRALAHVTALSVYSENNIPGQKPIIVGVREQRLTMMGMSILIGCTIMMSPILKHIPLAVLFGVFLYMGVSSLSSTQMFERISLLFIPAVNHPSSAVYVRKVKTSKMHLYTIIQLSMLGVLWAIKSTKELALAFPFILMFLAPVRLQLKYLFTENELEALDGDVVPA